MLFSFVFHHHHFFLLVRIPLIPLHSVCVCVHVNTFLFVVNSTTFIIPSLYLSGLTLGSFFSPFSTSYLTQILAFNFAFFLLLLFWYAHNMHAFVDIGLTVFPPRVFSLHSSGVAPFFNFTHFTIVLLNRFGFICPILILYLRSRNDGLRFSSIY